MEPRITLITLGVADLPRAVDFYRKLGFSTKGIVGTEFEYGAVAFFDLASGLRLALWPRASIAHDTGLPISPPGPTNFTLAHNVRTAEEVDQILASAVTAGGQVLKPGKKAFWGGYTGYFLDTEGNVWEVAWNPAMLPPGGGGAAG